MELVDGSSTWCVFWWLLAAETWDAEKAKYGRINMPSLTLGGHAGTMMLWLENDRRCTNYSVLSHEPLSLLFGAIVSLAVFVITLIDRRQVAE